MRLYEIKGRARLVKAATGDLYHGTSHAALLRIVATDQMFATSDNVHDNGISLTRNFEKAKLFAQRTVGNAYEIGYQSDPSDPETLPFLAEFETKGDDGVVMVFDRVALASHNVQPIEPGIEWNMGMDNDEEEERIITDDMRNVLRHVKAIMIINRQRYEAFKRFVLRYNKPYARAFRKIEQLT